MNFLKGFLGGVVFAIILIVVMIPVMSADSHKDFADLISEPFLWGIIELIISCGFIVGLIYQFLAWIGKKNREKQETNDLMREYLEKKLREEAEKENK